MIPAVVSLASALLALAAERQKPQRASILLQAIEEVIEMAEGARPSDPVEQDPDEEVVRQTRGALRETIEGALQAWQEEVRSDPDLRDTFVDSTIGDRILDAYRVLTETGVGNEDLDYILLKLEQSKILLARVQGPT
jgi:hypothetical protein